MSNEEPPVEIPISDSLDLHPFSPRDIPSVVAEYLDAAHARGFRLVRLVHGRGIGVQRRAVHQVLSTHPRVVRYWDAPESHLGATLAELTGH